MKRRQIIIGAVAALAIGGSAYGFRLWTRGVKESPYITVPVQKGSITQVVTATGSLSAVVTVQVGSQVSGTIDKLYADFNSKVKKNQVIAQLNQDKFQAAVDQGRANVLAAQANVTKAKATLDDAKRTLERNKELRKRDLIAMSDFETSQANYDAAAAQYEVNKAQVGQAQAALNQSVVDLNNTVIRSPVDGIVVSRNVDVGQTVAASLQAPVLFLIANDLSKMQVDTNVSEGDVGNVWINQDVTFSVDAHPTRRFRGKVLQVRNAAIMVQNVVTYDAVIGVNNEELLLKPGMTANVEFLVSRKDNVLKIPNAALRFRPPSERQNARTAALNQNQGAGAAERPAGSGGGGGRRPGGANSGQSGRPREGAGNRQGTVYVVRDEKAMPVKVRLGISDGSSGEVLSGDLKEGDQVILSMASTQGPNTPRRFFGF
ncbi:MAG TPA: efflux RND transporter periplasmic adaptor subunit [Candidatus Binatia bacterium]|jgi:HlyD family secretion protein